MTWDIEVGDAGLFDADVYYTCAAEDTGSTIELSFMGRTVRTRVAEVFDPPIVGAAQDRVPRTESYVKDFRPLRIGTLELPKGRGQLRLRAAEVRGKRVADVRYVALTRRG